MDKQALIKELDRLIQDNISLPVNYMIYNSAIIVAKEVIEREVPTIRPEIMAFAEAMENEMARRDETEGDSWKDESFTINDCVKEAIHHAVDLRLCLLKDDKETLIHQFVDIGNYAMMGFHKAKQ